MRTLKCFCAVLALTVSTAAQSAPTAAPRGTQTTAAPPQTRATGEVVSVDAHARQIRLKTDDGRQLSLQLDDATDLRRVPPGAARSAQAERIALAQVAVGDRAFARGTTN